MSVQPRSNRLPSAPAFRPLPASLKRDINRICHVLAQKAFYEFRRQMEEKARGLLRDGKSEADVLQSLTEDT